MLWKPKSLPAIVRRLRTALRSQYRMDGLTIMCLPHEMEPHEWDVVALLQAELANELVGEEELVYQQRKAKSPITNTKTCNSLELGFSA